LFSPNRGWIGEYINEIVIITFTESLLEKRVLLSDSMPLWDVVASRGHRRPERENVEVGVNRGTAPIYLEPVKLQMSNSNTTEAEKVQDGVDSGPNVFQRALRKFSTEDGEKGGSQSIAWTAVIGLFLLFAGFVLFVVGTSVGRRYAAKIDTAINTEFTSQEMQSILYAISICFTAVFAVLAIVSVQTLLIQEKKLDVYRYGARNTLETNKGRLWSSKQMKMYIMVMNVMYIVSACYFVIQISATWSLVLWYKDLHSITEPALSPEEQVQQILGTSGESNVTQQAVEDYIRTITEEFNSFLNQSSLDNLAAAEILCPGLFCVNLDALSFITSDECICNATTIEAVYAWSAQARTYFITALVGACLLFLSTLILGMRSMLAGSKAKVRLSQWEIVAPMLVPHGSPVARSNRHSSWDFHVEHRIRDQRVNSNQPKASVYLETPAGGMPDSEQESIDINTYFPAVQIPDIERGAKSELSIHSSTDSGDFKRRRHRAVSSHADHNDGAASSSDMSNGASQMSQVVPVVSNSIYRKDENEDIHLDDASSAIKTRSSMEEGRVEGNGNITTRPRVLFSIESDSRAKKSTVVSAYKAENSIHQQQTVSMVIDRLRTSSECQSKRSSSHHTSEASDGDINPFLHRH
jgi:hypothetical protein